MADSMCGPSNASKSLVAHADRDRSMYQDRFTSNAQAGASASFRSNTPFGQHAENGFNDFQQANLPPHLAVNHMAPAGDRPFVHPPVNHMAHPPPMNLAPVVFAPSPMGKMVDKGWVNEFSTMNLGPEVARPLPAQPNTVAPVQVPWGPSAMGLQSQQRPFFMTPSPAFGSMMGNAPPLSAPQLAEPSAKEGHVDLEAFNRAFGDYDEMLFEQDIAAWKGQTTADQKAADQEFEKAEAEWMSKHGPRADYERNLVELERQNREEQVQQQEQMDPKPEDAEALKKRREDEQLARAATDIISSVSDNSTDKFQNSRFLELMRRIANREVVVDGENFVDAETGEGLAKDSDAGNDGDQQLRSEPPSNQNSAN